MHFRRHFIAALVSTAFTCPLLHAAEPGISSAEILIGSTQPFSGPASSYGSVGFAAESYFAKINDEGGIHGRKLKLMALDDAFTPSKTVEQTRKLVEQENVFLMFASQGAAPNASVQKYLNAKKVPQLFVMSGSHIFQTPDKTPWTVPGLLSYYAESRAYASHILRDTPNARVGVLYQNDDFGKDYLRGIKAGLGTQTSKVMVAEQSYELTDPTVDSQVVALRAAGVDTLVMGTLSKQTSQAIRKIHDLGWKPTIYLSYISASVSPTLVNAGLDKSVGILTATVIKDPTDPRWHQDADYLEWLAWMKKYYPKGDISSMNNVYAYVASNTLVHVLRAAGPNPTREEVLRRLTTLSDYAAPMLAPGLKMRFTPTDYTGFRRMQLQRFDGAKWVPVGGPIGDGS
ncbi:ABC transporter substrate-binding protein [Variovorax sp. J31P207]|uniref:ABC transporter substrate-binding protein n=1 Tax=Variovorax sp. J31P207 TaxID=3053510 RepID=UPI0025780D3E|nr:ABC transporter substrate-binding protein [Variovorax sp. J31P207]MDM0072702.1 ABC transporter substrate-binding protein [Variovorax sp. J31P207]